MGSGRIAGPQRPTVFAVAVELSCLLPAGLSGSRTVSLQSFLSPYEPVSLRCRVEGGAQVWVSPLDIEIGTP